MHRSLRQFGPLSRKWVSECVCVCVCLTFCDLMECSPPGSSVQGIFHARILEWVAIFPTPADRSSQRRDWIRVSCVSIGRWILYHCTTWEAFQSLIPLISNLFIFPLFIISLLFPTLFSASQDCLILFWTSHLFIIFLVPIAFPICLYFIFFVGKTFLWLPSKVYLPINVVLKTPGLQVYTFIPTKYLNLMKFLEPWLDCHFLNPSSLTQSSPTVLDYIYGKTFFKVLPPSPLPVPGTARIICLASKS